MIDKSRLGRAARLGGIAAGHAARGVGTRAANLTRSDERSEEAIGRHYLDTADRMVAVLGKMKGASMKLGQTLSVVDVGVVPEPYREEFQAKLASLQQSTVEVSFEGMRSVIEEDLGASIESEFAEFAEEPIAAASIGQVYRAKLKDGREVAVKVQYPGIDEAVRADLKNLGMVLKLLSRIMPGLDSNEVAAEIRTRVTDELDYELEAQNHRSVARAFRDHPFIVVPAVVTSLSRSHVITTEFVDGARFADVRDRPEAERARMAEILFRFYVNAPFRHRLLSGDPHPGNSLFLDDGRVAFLDFGFFKKLEPSSLEDQRQAMVAAMDRDADRLFELLAGSGMVSEGDGRAETLLEKYLDATEWFLIDEEVEITPDAATRVIMEYGTLGSDGFGEVKPPAEHLMSLRAILLTLGILGQLRATANWHAIAGEWLLAAAPSTELGELEATWAGTA